MTELFNDFVYVEQPRPFAEWDLRERAYAAQSFWGAVGGDLDKSLIRDHGMDRWCQHTTTVYASHQRQFFLQGVEKLGIGGQPPAVTAAMYHALSNAVGGIRMKYVIESPQKAWIFYHPYLLTGGASLYPDDFMLAIFGGWHVRNGDSLGSEGLTFNVTHLQSRGDPFDAGYFEDTGTPVPLEERLRVRFDEEAPPLADRKYPEVDGDQWPAERRVKALRNFAVDWTWDQIPRAVAGFGAEGLPAIKHGFETALYSYMPYYTAALSGGPVELAAGFFAAVHEINGWKVTKTAEGDDITVALDRDPIKLLGGDLPDESIAATYGAITEGWSGPVAELGATITLGSSGGNPAWTFGPLKRA